MNRYWILPLLFLGSMQGYKVYAQLSPGDLASAHAHLEGLTNCTECHSLGEHVTDQKCLDCHSEIQSRLDADLGFHTTVRDTACIACHSDHNGRNFNMIRWPNEDVTQFGHERTGYVLEGKHQTAECRQCHKADFVKAADILDVRAESLDHTFLGLDRACLSCHEDEHRGQLVETCDSCHSLDAWKPAEKFDHNNAQFALLGRHEKVDCEKCHKPEVLEVAPELVDMVRYKPIAFEGCVPCHEDPHQGRFQESCESCHSVDGWHEDTKKDFDHNLTRFPLAAKHQSVKCETCHKEREQWFKPAFAQCADCHKDVHAGQFASRLDGGACESCHSENGFMPAQFGIVDHEQTRFVLREAHQAVPCGLCHQKGEDGVVNFAWEVERFTCETCHTSPHGEQFVAQIAQEGCTFCHNEATWLETGVNHDLARFPLVGKHQTVECESCHPVVEFAAGGKGQLFTPIDTACQHCHEDPHDRQFAKDNMTDCERCHTNDAWTADLFVHDRDSQFALTGAHETVDCNKCHETVTFSDGKQGRMYRPLDVACASCHGGK